MHSDIRPNSPGTVRTRYLLPLALVALVAALFGSGVVQRAHAAPGDPPPAYNILGTHNVTICSPACATGTLTITSENPVNGNITGAFDLTVTDGNSQTHTLHIPGTAELAGDVIQNFTPASQEALLVDGHSVSQWPAWDISGAIGDITIDGGTGIGTGSEQLTYTANGPSDSATYTGATDVNTWDLAGTNVQAAWHVNNTTLPDPLDIVVDFAPLAPYCPADTCYVATNGNDTTGDGSQAHPFRTIQQGVDVRAAHYYYGSGVAGTVIVGAGTYNESVRLYAPVTLQGAGAGQDAHTYSGPRTIINAKGIGDGHGIVLSAGDGITIDGFWFEGNAAGVLADTAASYNTIINNTFFNNSQGIAIYGWEGDLAIQHNVFYWNRNQAHDDPGYGIYVYGSLDGVLIDSNTFSGNNVAAIEFTGSGARNDAVISNNTSSGDGHFAVLNNFQSDHAEGCDGDTYALICDNTVTQALGDAIVVGTHAGGFNITRNTISRGNGAAIAVTDSSSGQMDIYFNTLSANQYGINLQQGGYISIAGNQIVSNRTAGINVGAGFFTGGNEEPGLVVNYNLFVSNHAGLVNQGGVENAFDATCNYWNSQNGPRIASNPGAWGDTIAGLDRGDYRAWLTTSDIFSSCDHGNPSVTITAPTETNYAIRQRVTPSFACADGDSGIASCKAYVNTGSVYDASTAKAGYYFSTNVAGTFTYTVVAIDHAGNTFEESVTYTVGNQP